MSAELTVLTLAALLQVVQFLLYALPANREIGPGYTMSARDRAPSRALSDKTARLGRAFDNHFEALILFAIAALVIEVSGQNSALTAACAWTYLIARILYIPAYALGLRPHRSLIWCVSWLALTLMLIAALF
ncbi:MAG: MAPEG family protein [Sulfitobacter sp.]